MQLVERQEEFKNVTDWDFTFNNGYRIPITIDEAVGDKVEEQEDRYVLNLTEKSGMLDPEDKLPAELATVFKANLLTVVVRHRKQRIPTAEEQFDMRKLLHKVPKQPM